MTITKISVETQRELASKFDNELVQDILRNASVEGYRYTTSINPRSMRRDLQSAIHSTLASLAIYPLEERRKGRILDGNFRVHLSIHQDTPQEVSSLDDIWVNYLVTGDCPSERGVGSKLKHKGKVKLRSVAADFSDGLCNGITASQDEMIKRHINELQSKFTGYDVIFATDRIGDIYEAFCEINNTTSCMGQPRHAFVDGVAPTDCYNNSPNLKLALYVKGSVESYSGQDFPFKGRQISLFNTQGNWQGVSNFYGLEALCYSNPFIAALSLNGNIHGGLITPQWLDGRLVIPYVDHCEDTNELVWLSDIKQDYLDDAMSNIVPEGLDGQQFIFCGAPYGNYHNGSFGVQGTNDGEEVMFVNSFNYQRFFTPEVTTPYYWEKDKVWSDYHERYISEDDSVWSNYHDTHILEYDSVSYGEWNDQYIHEDLAYKLAECAISRDKYLEEDMEYSDYHEVYFHEDKNDDRDFIYSAELSDWYRSDCESDFYEYHNYVLVNDEWVDEDDTVYSNFKEIHILESDAIPTPCGDYVLLEHVMEYCEAHPDAQYDDSTQEFEAA